MDNYSLAIVGAGAIVESHLDAIKKLPSFKVTGVCDINSERCEKIAKETGSTAYADYEDLLTVCPDVVLIATPHGLHCSMAVAALEAGCNVLVEKPISASVQESRMMLSAAEKFNKTLLVAEIDAFRPGAVCTGEHFKKGNLGRFFTGVCCNHRRYFSPDRPQWFLDPDMSGGGMFSNVGLHRLAVTRACLPGKKPVAVSGAVSYQPGIDIEACTSAFVRYESGGAVMYEEVGYYPKASWINTGVHYVFEEGVVAWDEEKWQILGKDGQVSCELLPPYRRYDPVYECLLKALRGQEYGPHAGDFAEDVAIAQAAYESSRTGKEIDIRSYDWNVNQWKPYNRIK